MEDQLVGHGQPGEGVVNGHGDPILVGIAEVVGDVHLEGDVTAAVVAGVLTVDVHGRRVVHRTKSNIAAGVVIKQGNVRLSVVLILFDKRQDPDQTK